MLPASIVCSLMIVSHSHWQLNAVLPTSMHHLCHPPPPHSTPSHSSLPFPPPSRWHLPARSSHSMLAAQLWSRWRGPYWDWRQRPPAPSSLPLPLPLPSLFSRLVPARSRRSRAGAPPLLAWCSRFCWPYRARPCREESEHDDMRTRRPCFLNAVLASNRRSVTYP